MDDQDLEIEAMMARARPRPPELFIEGLERRLLGRPERKRVRPGRSRTLLAGLGLTGVLAATAFALGLAGAGPVSLGESEVRAIDTCTTVVVRRPERIGVVEQGRDGKPVVVQRVQLVSRLVMRCG